MNFVPPSGIIDLYPRKKPGYAGEFGDGANVKIKFLQTAITREELDSIDLIENIPGSEKWEVRDLFQRTVDKERVGSSILPYLQDDEKVKFFNPLTLMLIPYDTDTASIEKELQYIENTTEIISENEYDVLEKTGYFRYMRHKSEPAYSYLEWNDQKIKVVAVDGQHRLSALKRWKDDPDKSTDLSGWHIPVVLLTMFKSEDDAEAPNILEVVRKTFIYINSTAEAINESRRILLDDESLNCICCQEVVQVAHENDQKDIAHLDSSKVPLMFYDWRGEVIGGKLHPGPAAIKNVEEVKGWFDYYILGNDGGIKQKRRLNIEDMVPPLKSFGEDRKLTHHDAEALREQFKMHLLPAYNYVMENFMPYKKYIMECRAKQYEATNGDDLAKHAFQKICFGSHRAGNELNEAVNERYHEIVGDFTLIKQSALHELLARDVGMRGIWYAFDFLKKMKDIAANETVEWLEYAEWFVNEINKIYDCGWFKSYEDIVKKHRKLLTHIVYDQSGAIINYKFSDVSDALGSLLSALILKSCDEEFTEQCWSELENNMKKPLRKGFRKDARATLRDTWQGTPQEFNSEVNKVAEKSVNKRLKEIFKEIK